MSASVDNWAIAKTLLALVLVVAVIGTVFYVVGLNQINEGHVGVETNRGAATGEVQDPGWHWVNPLTSDVKERSVRPQTVDYNGDQSIYVITQDGQDVWVDVTVRYALDANETLTFYDQYNTHGQAQNRLIEPTVRSDIRDEASAISAREIITQDGRQSLEQTAAEALRENFEGSGLELEAVQVRGVELNDEFSAELEQIEIENTEAERKLIEAEADANAEIERAEGEAEANRIRDESLTDDVLKDKWLNQIDDSDKVIVTDGTGEDMIIDTATPNSTDVQSQPANTNDSGNESGGE